MWQPAEEAWKPVAGAAGVEVPEVPFVPNEVTRQRSWQRLRYVALLHPLPGQLGLGTNELTPGKGRPAMRLRLLFTNIPDPEEEPTADKHERLPPLSGAEVMRLLNGRCGEGEDPRDPEA